MIKTPIILASQSPRRKELLEKANIPFEIFIPEVEEIYPEDMDPKEVPVYLAGLKAEAAQQQYNSDDNPVILAADVIVIQEGQIFEKPVDRQDAIRMLKALSGKEHLVISGVCILQGEKMISFSNTTKIKFYPLSQNEIEYYIDSFEPYDKAGSYGIQDWIGFCKIERLEGSYSNVMGLPVQQVYHYLQNFLG